MLQECTAACQDETDGGGGGRMRNPCDPKTETARASVRKHGCRVGEEESGLSKCASARWEP